MNLTVFAANLNRVFVDVYDDTLGRSSGSAKNCAHLLVNTVAKVVCSLYQRRLRLRERKRLSRHTRAHQQTLTLNGLRKRHHSRSTRHKRRRGRDNVIDFFGLGETERVIAYDRQALLSGLELAGESDDARGEVTSRDNLLFSGTSVDHLRVELIIAALKSAVSRTQVETELTAITAPKAGTSFTPYAEHAARHGRAVDHTAVLYGVTVGLAHRKNTVRVVRQKAVLCRQNFVGSDERELAIGVTDEHAVVRSNEIVDQLRPRAVHGTGVMARMKLRRCGKHKSAVDKACKLCRLCHFRPGKPAFSRQDLCTRVVALWAACGVDNTQVARLYASGFETSRSL